MKIHLGVSALAGSNGSLMDKNVMAQQRWGRVVKKICFKFFGVASLMLTPEDSKKNIIRLRWAKVLKKIKSL